MKIRRDVYQAIADPMRKEITNLVAANMITEIIGKYGNFADALVLEFSFESNVHSSFGISL